MALVKPNLEKRIRNPYEERLAKDEVWKTTAYLYASIHSDCVLQELCHEALSLLVVKENDPDNRKELVESLQKNIADFLSSSAYSNKAFRNMLGSTEALKNGARTIVTLARKQTTDWAKFDKIIEGKATLAKEAQKDLENLRDLAFKEFVDKLAKYLEGGAATVQDLIETIRKAEWTPKIQEEEDKIEKLTLELKNAGEDFAPSAAQYARAAAVMNNSRMATAEIEQSTQHTQRILGDLEERAAKAATNGTEKMKVRFLFWTVLNHTKETSDMEHQQLKCRYHEIASDLAMKTEKLEKCLDNLVESEAQYREIEAKFRDTKTAHDNQVLRITTAITSSMDTIQRLRNQQIKAEEDAAGILNRYGLSNLSSAVRLLSSLSCMTEEGLQGVNKISSIAANWRNLIACYTDAYELAKLGELEFATEELQKTLLPPLQALDHLNLDLLQIEAKQQQALEGRRNSASICN